MCISRSVLSNSLWPHRLYPARLLCPWNSPNKNTGVGSHSLFQGIFPTQGWNPGLLYWRQILYCLSHQGSPLRCTHIWNLHIVYFKYNCNFLNYTPIKLKKGKWIKNFKGIIFLLKLPTDPHLKKSKNQRLYSKSPTGVCTLDFSHLSNHTGHSLPNHTDFLTRPAPTSRSLHQLFPKPL